MCPGAGCARASCCGCHRPAPGTPRPWARIAPAIDPSTNQVGVPGPVRVTPCRQGPGRRRSCRGRLQQRRVNVQKPGWEALSDQPLG